MVALSTLIGGSGSSTTAASTNYEWGAPKVSAGTTLTACCSTLGVCACCCDCTAFAAGAGNCYCCRNSSWGMQALGPDCVVMYRSSCWSTVASVYSIASDGTLAKMGSECELFNWACEYSCCFSSCCYSYSPNYMSCCVRDQTSHSEQSDMCGRFYALIHHGGHDCNQSGYTCCINLKGFCWDSATCQWCRFVDCRTPAGTPEDPQDACFWQNLQNPIPGVVSYRSHGCNCFNNNRMCTGIMIHGVKRAFTLFCGNCCNTGCGDRPVFWGRTGTYNLIAFPHNEYACGFAGTGVTIDMDSCTFSRTTCYPNLSVTGCQCCVNAHGPFPISTASVDYLFTNFCIGACCHATLCNTYVGTNGAVWQKLEANSCGQSSGCYAHDVNARAAQWAAWGAGKCASQQNGTGGQFCNDSNNPNFTSTCANRCQFGGYGGMMIDGYYVDRCNRDIRDITSVRGDVDYAPFDIALGVTSMQKFICDKTGCTNLSCHRNMALLDNKWLVQLCCDGQGSGYICAKLVVYGYNSSC